MSVRAVPATVLLLLSGTAAAQTPAPLPHPSVGDSFRYSGNFATVACSQWTVTAVDRNGWDIRTCGPDTEFTRADSDALVRIVGPRGTLVEFSPASPALDFPLTLNKSWSAHYGGFTAINGAHFQSDETCRVSGWETVRVPAGAFPAYRIDCNDHWTSGGASGQAHQASWYAPSARTVVEARNDQQPQWDFQLVSETLR